MSDKYGELYVNVLDIKFYVCDEEGNELTKPDGSIKEFYCKGRLKPPCEIVTGKHKT